MKTFRYRLYPNKAQTTLLNKHFGAVRFVYNWGLEQKVKAYQTEKKRVSCFDLMSTLASELKIEFPWLKEVNAQSLQSTLRNLDNAFTSFFKKQTKFPRFKTKRDKQSFQCPQKCSVDFESNVLNIPKLHGLKIKFHRQFQGKIKTVSIIKTKANKFFATILVEDGIPHPTPKPPIITEAIGVDLGIKDFAVLSTGEKISNPKHYKQGEKKLIRLQRRITNKQLGSKNRDKAIHKFAIQYEKVVNRRTDFLHKLSKRLIDENQTVCLEDLSVRNMVKNRRVSKAIQTCGWSIFRKFCEYKATWYGKTIKIIGRFEPSSRLCDSCGQINKELKLSDRTWTCTCGKVHDRDTLAARNILNFAFVNTAGSAEI